MRSFIQNLVAMTLLVAGSSAFAQEMYKPISPLEVEKYAYYQRAINFDQNFINAGLIGDWWPLDSFAELPPVKGSEQLWGRIVTFKNGLRGNQQNLVLTINNELYFVPTELANMSGRVTLARRWKDAKRPDALEGMYLVIRGERIGKISRELIPVHIELRIATPMGRMLPAIEYYEDVLQQD